MNKLSPAAAVGPRCTSPGSRSGTALLLAISCLAALSAHAADWVGVWGAAPAFPTGPSIANQTIRQSIRLSLGGRALRIRLSNEMGANPLVIGNVHVARPGSTPGSIDPHSDQILTFGANRSVTLQPGVPMLSDPLPLQTTALETVVISLFVPRATGPTATHPLGEATTLIVDGDMTSAENFNEPTKTTARFFLSAIEVDRDGAQAVVGFGDSITDGYGSTVDGNGRWPDVLAERLAKGRQPVAVVDAGISGNRLLHDVPDAEFGPNALARFDRDALAVAHVRTVILLEAINDIGIPGADSVSEQSVTADEIIASMNQLIARAHAHGVRLIGGTLTPFTDSAFPGYYSAAGEAKRQSVNHWIREGHGFDGVVDFDTALRDPQQPNRLLPAYDSGDHLHPNDVGYRKMAETINLDSLISPK